MMNLAHRGASTYAPENTFSAFYLGLSMGASGIETDIKRTADGQLVLFHDDTTARISDVDLAIADCTVEQLMAVDVGSYRGPQYKGERIVLAEDFFRVFGAYDIDLAIELKDDFVEEDTLALIAKHVKDTSRLCLTAFGYDNLVRARALHPTIALGFLTDNCLDESLDRCAAIGAIQICPHVNTLTPENVAHAHERGFVVRSWGNDTPARMIQSLSCGVDGMTINFPDLLTKTFAISGVGVVMT